MNNLFIISDKLSKNLLINKNLSINKEIINEYKKPIIIVSSIVGGLIVGGLVIRKIYKIKNEKKLLKFDKKQIKFIDCRTDEEFDRIINDAKQLIEQIQNYRKCILLKKQQNAIKQDNGSTFKRRDSISSNSSTEFFDTEPNIHFFKLYTDSLENLDTIIKPRINRNELTNCDSLEEFYAKVNCIRNGFTHILSKEDNCNYFKQIGEFILKILITNNKEQKKCLTIYNDLIEFVSNSNNHKIIEQELKSPNIPILNFYDLVLDYIILDSFDDLDNPPSFVLIIMNQNWFSDQFKKIFIEKVISLSINNMSNKILNNNLKIKDGFLIRLYSILKFILPIFALDTFNLNDNNQKLKCSLIKQLFYGLINDLFNFNCIRFTNINDLTIDMLTVIDIRFKDLEKKLSIVS